MLPKKCKMFMLLPCKDLLDIFNFQKYQLKMANLIKNSSSINFHHASVK